MNTAFEKWFEEDGQYETDVLGASGAGWRAAIQSLEVTPELVSIAHDAYEGATDHTAINYAMEAAVRAVLSALKEQAK